ncbi:hypothetical protein MUG78_17195 [Gordonia alkaliphila]|uniref:FtsK/SpoIIIE domain-containing protein n=1 Tax=Gordonia alkaliphila TaxID=1053547 RepID=UPI001FF5797C|nr:FtsK/SpoIIIE domain-containing protein [Gordonia alkaliphila]MCK0441138.1 hypothetical protein [Gordonia alkaliphila]
MAKQVFIAPQRKPGAPIPPKSETIPEPIPHPTKKKTSIMAVLLPVLMMVGMIGMVSLMAIQMKQTTGQINPMMLMMPLFLIPAMLPMLMNQASGVDMGELHESRVNFVLAEREVRETIHDQGELVHDQQARQFPAPDALINYVGSRNADHPIMWQVNANERGGLHVPDALMGDDEDRKHITYEAYLAPRIGVGTVRRMPPLDLGNNQQVSELLEATTQVMWRRFVMIQSFMPAMPVALNLGSAPFYSFEGDGEAIVSAARAMICSLAFNHSPADLKIGIISPDIGEDSEWSWLKWLPHLEDPSRRDRHGIARHAYRSLDEFAQAHHSDLASRKKFLAETEITTNRWIIFIDAPGRELTAPAVIGDGVDGVSFVVLRGHSSQLVTDPRNMFRITADRDLVSATGATQAKVDQVSVLDALLLAKKLSQYTATALASYELVDDTEEEEIPGFLELMGIDNISQWDPRERWNSIRHDSHLKFPIGNVRDAAHPKEAIRTPKLAYLDLIEMAQGGFPHGAGQGQTGAGKSFLLNAWILTLMTLFGPDRLNLILADFKGGSAFSPFRGLPHVTQVVTNLDDDMELVHRLGLVLEGEVQRRLQYLEKHGNAKDIYAYRQLMKENPQEHPPLPDLLVIIDEYAKFSQMMKDMPANARQALLDIGQQGRSLGIHLMPFSQALDAAQMGEDLWKHMQFFVTLATADERASLGMVKSPQGHYLKAGAAIIRYGSSDLVPFMAFNIEAEYTPQDRPVIIEEDAEPAPEPLDTDLVPFTLENLELESDQDQAPLSQLDSLLAADVTEDDQNSSRPRVPIQDQVITHMIARLRELDQIETARQMWQPTLREPVTLHPDTLIVSPITDIADPTITLGLIDDAYGHARPPLSLRLDGAMSNVCISGQGRSGRTQTLAALIGSASISHDPALMSFYIVDPTGAGLSYMSEFINVGGYASQSDTDLTDRLLGEATRLIDHREASMSTSLATSFAEYFTRKQSVPDREDPYGHYVLVIDRLDTLLDRNPTLQAQIERILNSGSAVGVHLVATAQDLGYRIKTSFGYIHLAGGDSDATTNRLHKLAVTEIDPDYPGRTTSYYKKRDSFLDARILIPTTELIEPTGYEPGSDDTRPIWPTDFTSQIREFGQRIRAYKEGRGTMAAPRVAVVADVVDFADFWREFSTTPVHQSEKALALGVNRRDLRPVLAPSSHLLVAGTNRSGRTNALRVYINSIVSTYSPAEAQIFIADPRFQLRAEYDVLRANGYSMEDRGYAYDETSANAMGEALNTYIANRTPDLDTLTAEQLASGKFYEGPHIFVLIDNLAQFNLSGSQHVISTVFDVVTDAMRGFDIGVSFIVTLSEIDLEAFRNSAGLNKVFQSSMTPLLGLSGSSQTILRPRMGDHVEAIKFSIRRPGEAILYRPDNPVDVEIVQMPQVLPWGQAPKPADDSPEGGRHRG